MWSEEKIQEYLKKNLKPSRFQHSLQVRDSAMALAKQFNVDIDKARVAGLIHDCAKNLNNEEILYVIGNNKAAISEVALKNPQILHGLAGAIIAKKTFKVKDIEILDAVTFHTTGRRAMTPLDKIIYLADYIEPSRDFPEVNILRELASKSLEKALIFAFNNTINYVLIKGELLHLDTIIARNDLISNDNFKEE